MMVLVQLPHVVVALLLFVPGKGEESVKATLYPDTYSHGEVSAKADNAIDGRTSIGESVGVSLLHCASTNYPSQLRPLQYLEIDLGRIYSIAAVRLHLRDGIPRRIGQSGLVVNVSNSTINDASEGVQCGEAYNDKFEQSPLFSCWKPGRYVYAVLRDSLYPLQVCEMQIFKEMKLSLATATLIPNEAYENNGVKALAQNSVDGLSRIGESGANGGQKCAGLKLQNVSRLLECLRIDLGHRQQVYAIRLHLRDGRAIFEKQKGMIVSINDDYLTPSFSDNCGSYDPAEGQSPEFYCKNSSARYVWMSTTKYPKWPLFICEVEVYADIRCLMPANPPNGKYKVTRLTHGGCLTLSCEDGFIPSSRELVTCETSGNWSLPLPTCQNIRCSIPTSPPNGRYNVTRLTQGGSLCVSCDEGFRPSSSEPVICESSGNWSTPLPKCQEACRNISNNEIDNGHLQLSGVTMGSTATFTCDPGFTIQQNHSNMHIRVTTVTCVQRNGMEGAEWNKPVPTCILDASCERPPRVVNGFTRVTNGVLVHVGDSQRSIVGTTVEYSCNEGYFLSGQKNRRQTCLTTGRWSGSAPTCNKYVCSNCHRDADCTEDNYCRCKQGFVGNGSYCCSEDMYSRMAKMAGEAVVFECNHNCTHMSFLFAKWYKNDIPLNLPQTRYLLTSNGVILILKQVTPADSGEYKCEGHVGHGQTIYERYVSLTVKALDCGISRSSTRKSKGNSTYPGQFPWQAMLCLTPRGHHCSGTLVSPNCIITAGHCLRQGDAHNRNLTVCLGHHCGNCPAIDMNGSRQCYPFNQGLFTIHHHSHFRTVARTYHNDIAIIKLKQPALMDFTNVYPVCLPNQGDRQYIQKRKRGVVTGWGELHSPVSGTGCLRKCHVRLQSHTLCRRKHNNDKYRYTISDSMRCATDDNKVCKGESGGPLVVKNEDRDRYVLAGLVSWRIPYGKAKKLGVYTDVLSYVDWVKRICGLSSQ